jgi:hypothetical protein
MVILMRCEGQGIQKLRGKLPNVAVMVVKEIEIAMRPPEGVGFFNGGLQCGAGNVMINRLTEMVVVNGVVEDDIPNGLQQVAVRFGRLGDLVLIVFEGLPGLFMP